MISYDYVNGLGRKKRITINTSNIKDGKYYNYIFDMQTGEFCGGGYNSKEELVRFLANYGITADF